MRTAGAQCVPRTRGRAGRGIGDQPVVTASSGSATSCLHGFPGPCVSQDDHFPLPRGSRCYRAPRDPPGLGGSDTQVGDVTPNPCSSGWHLPLPASQPSVTVSRASHPVCRRGDTPTPQEARAEHQRLLRGPGNGRRLQSAPQSRVGTVCRARVRGASGGRAVQSWPGSARGFPLREDMPARRGRGAV